MSEYLDREAKIRQILEDSGLEFLPGDNGEGFVVMTPLGEMTIKDCNTFLALRFCEPRWVNKYLSGSDSTPLLLSYQINPFSGKWNIMETGESAISSLRFRIRSLCRLVKNPEGAK